MLFQSEQPSYTTTQELLTLVARSAGQAGLSTLVTLSLGVPLAVAVSTFEFRGRSALVALVSIPFVMPSVVTGIAIRGLTTAQIEPGIALVLLGHSLVNLAVVLRLVGTAIEYFDVRLLVQARALGATRFAAIWTIAVPLLRPALLRSAAVIFTFCFSSLGLVLTLGDRSIRTLESQALRQVSLLLDFRGAAMTTSAQFVVIAIVLWWGNQQHLISLAMAARAQPRKQLRLLSPIRFGLAIVTLLFAAPIGWLIASALLVNGQPTLSYLEIAWTESDLRGSLLYSLLLAACVGLTTAAIAIAAGVVASESRWRKFGNIALLPMLFTSATIGLGMLLTFGRAPFSLDRSGLPLVLAQSLLALPLCYLFVVGRIESVVPRMQIVARSLGARGVRAFLTAYGTVVAAAGAGAFGLAAAISLGEFGAASFLSDVQRPALSVLLMRQLGRPGESSLAIASVIALVLAVSAATAIGGSFIARRRIEGIRR